MNEKFDLKKIPEKFYDGLSRLFYKLGINGNDVVDDFIYAYINYAYQQSQKRTDIYSATGFGRKFVNNYFNNIKLRSNPQIAKDHKTLIGALQVLFDNSENELIKIRGKEDSFNCAFNLVRSPYNNISAQSVLDKFIRVGILEKVDDKYIKLVASIPTKEGLREPDDIIRLLTDNMNRLCHTLLHNMCAEKNSDTYVQLSYWSNEIDSNYHRACTEELNEETRKYLENCSIIIDKFEKKGFSKNQAETKNIELGVSAFIFKNLK